MKSPKKKIYWLISLLVLLVILWFAYNWHLRPKTETGEVEIETYRLLAQLREGIYENNFIKNSLTRRKLMQLGPQAGPIVLEAFKDQEIIRGEWCQKLAENNEFLDKNDSLRADLAMILGEYKYEPAVPELLKVFDQEKCQNEEFGYEYQINFIFFVRLALEEITGENLSDRYQQKVSAEIEKIKNLSLQKSQKESSSNLENPEETDDQ